MESYENTRRRRNGVTRIVSPPETEVDRIFGQLFPTPLPPTPRRRLRKIIRQADGAKILVEYAAEVDPRTGEQLVNVQVYTTKVECPRCGRLVSYTTLYKCHDCDKMVCGNCLTSRKIFLGGKPVCWNCYYARARG